MSWKICDCFCCCRCLKKLEKEDDNQIYGDYYYSDGERRAGVLEVVFTTTANTQPWPSKNHYFHKIIWQ